MRNALIIVLLCVTLVIGMMLLPSGSEGGGFKLLPQASQGGAGFGNAVVMEARALYVGEWARSDGEARPKAGAVHIFEPANDGWAVTKELAPAVRGANQRFGASLALDGDTLLVGAPGLFGVKPESLKGESNTGAVYVFERIDGEWLERAVLRAEAGNQGDSFGYSLALEGDRALVGAIGREGPAPGAGAAYVFERNEGIWQQVEVLRAGDASGGSLFGHAVALSGDTAVVGANRDGNASGLRRGAVYLFEHNSSRFAARRWKQMAKFAAPGAAVKGRLGHALDVEGDVAVVAERLRPPSGVVHVYSLQQGQWREDAVLRSPSPSANEFGWAVDLSGGEILIGDRSDSGDGQRAGAAFRFARDEDGAWVVRETYRSLSPCDDGEFGLSVALGFGRALVGAWKEDSTESATGAAYVFE